MKNKLKNLDVDKMVAAVIADDPDAAVIADDLTNALNSLKAGRFGRTTVVPVNSIAVTRHKTGLSQDKFARRLGISVSTLKSWEQGQRSPSGAASTLLRLINHRPELIKDLETIQTP